MGEAGVVDLCRRLVVLTDELEVVRGELKRALLNGVGSGAEEADEDRRPFVAVSRRVGVREAAASEAEASLVRLLEDQPGLGTAAVAKAMGSKVNTTAERLKRLRKKGEVTGGGAGGWRTATEMGTAG